MQWHYEAPGMCVSLIKYSTYLQKIVTDHPTKLGTEAPSPELKNAYGKTNEKKTHTNQELIEKKM